MILEALYWLAAVLALYGALRGNLIAWPLLASFAFYQYAVWAMLPYDPALWARVDRFVLLGIAFVVALRARDADWRPTIGDFAVLALYFPLFLAYRLPGDLAHLVSMSAAIGQLLLVFPARWALTGLRGSARNVVDHDEFDLRAMA